MDQQILDRVIMEARQAAVNSIRPARDPAAANDKGAAEKEKAKLAAKAAAAKRNRPPADFVNKVLAAAPDVCSCFAWAGECPESTGGTCKVKGTGKVLVHTCYQCRFKEGKHPLAGGKCTKC